MSDLLSHRPPHTLGRYMQAKIMKIKIYLLLLLSTCIGCSDTRTKELIEVEYLKLNKNSREKIIVNNIKLLEIKEIDFFELANVEVFRIKQINKLYNEKVRNQFKIDSLLTLKIKKYECIYPNANSEYQQKYRAEIKADSVRLNLMQTNRLNIEIAIATNELRVFDIEELAYIDSIQTTKNRWIKHKVNFRINNKVVEDTLVYVSFNNEHLQYLTVNPLIDW